jgi:hypothetical protein
LAPAAERRLAIGQELYTHVRPRLVFLQAERGNQEMRRHLQRGIYSRFLLNFFCFFFLFPLRRYT